MLWLSLLWWLALAAAPAHTPSLGSIKAKQLADLAELPNYTCTETVERSRRPASAPHLTPVDRVRLEIAVVGGIEMFGWPGNSKIDEKDVTRMVDGLIGSGDFAMHVRELFGGGGAEFVAVGDELREGRRALRYDYRVPVRSSGWLLQAPKGDPLPVAYHGTFWVDLDSLDLIELDVVADDLPRSLASAGVSKALKYRRARIGSSDFLLPVEAHLMTTDLAGEENQSDTRFHDCRQYTVESAIHFDAPEAAPNGPQAMRENRVALPGDFEVKATLETPIDSDTAAVGDPIRARVEQALKVHGATLVPKHAALEGRIARLEVVEGRRYLDLIFTHFDVDGARVDIGGRRNELHLEKRDIPRRQVVLGSPSFYIVPFPIRSDGPRGQLSEGAIIFVRSRTQ